MLTDNEWYDSDNPYGWKYRVFNDISDYPDGMYEYCGEYIRQNGVYYKWNSELGVYEESVEENFPDYYIVRGTTDSKLRGLRGYVQYINENGIVETPSGNEDWLFYYKIGRVESTTFITDMNGNIMKYGDQPLNVNQRIDDLYAYGDVITDINYNTETRTLNFKYVIGAHLTAVYEGNEQLDDGTYKYYYSNFAYDENDDHGIIYEETYTYSEGGDIDRLINTDNDFEHYVRDEIDLIYNFYNKYMYSKFEMTATNTAIVTFTFNNGEIRRPMIISSYNESVANNVDALYAPLYKKDYFCGVTYEPIIESDVKILRGNASAFEKFFKLGEIKTMYDLQNYSNGGFFTIESNDGEDRSET